MATILAIQFSMFIENKVKDFLHRLSFMSQSMILTCDESVP